MQLVLSDVDGTLLTSDKILTEKSVAAVQRLREAGIRFTIASSRPPQGLAMLLERLAVDAPVGAFNGGVFVDAARRVLDQHPLRRALVAPLVADLDRAGLDVWVYTATEWLVRDADAWHVAHEAKVVAFTPTVVDDLVGALDAAGGAVKVLGVSRDADRVVAAQTEVERRFGADVSATRSQSYYLDVTHPAANKGDVVDYLARTLGIPAAAIATIGDGQNDTLMFARSGTSVAMGNGTDDVKRAATAVTASNDEDGFAQAVDAIVLQEGHPSRVSRIVRSTQD